MACPFGFGQRETANFSGFQIFKPCRISALARKKPLILSGFSFTVPGLGLPRWPARYRAELQIPIRFRRKFMRFSSGAATRRRMRSSSSRSFCSRSVFGFGLRTGFDRFKRLVENLKHRPVARPVRRPLHSPLQPTPAARRSAWHCSLAPQRLFANLKSSTRVNPQNEKTARAQP